MNVHCANCGGTRVAMDPAKATLDERYPFIKCEDCGKAGSGIRGDVFDRTKWQIQKQEAAMRKPVKK